LYYDVHDATKLPNLGEGTNLAETREIGPLGKPIMEPAQWITGLYNSGIMNLMNIPHFGSGKNVHLCVKKLMNVVHKGILWMDRIVWINVALIVKIIGCPIVGTQPEEYLETKVHEKEVAEIVKGKFGTNKGNMVIDLKDINETVTLFTSNIMACKLLRKCRKEEAPTRVIEVNA
jgi:hypothetical protein